MSTQPQSAEPQSNLNARPERDTLLASTTQVYGALYTIVQRLLEDLETLLPWEFLYEPPEFAEEILPSLRGLVNLVDSIPSQIASSTAPGGDPAEVEEVEFLFRSIRGQLRGELDNLRSQLDLLEITAEEAPPSATERRELCELAADLKGKCASSVMGATASLIAGGRWNGAEIEPVLFADKAAEAERNTRLAEALERILAGIQGLPEEVPVVQLVRAWKKRQRADRYALTPLYTFLGEVGSLIRAQSRRALYSADFHQVRLREEALRERVNELNELNARTWDASPAELDAEIENIYAVLIRKTLELAAILDLEILRRLIGEKYLKNLLTVVTIESERRKEQSAQGHTSDPDNEDTTIGLMKGAPKALRSLVQLLREDDLKTFLEVLLGAVLKRSSFQRRQPATATRAATATPSTLDPEIAAPTASTPTASRDTGLRGTAASPGAEGPAANEALEVDINLIEVTEPAPVSPPESPGTPQVVRPTMPSMDDTSRLHPDREIDELSDTTFLKIVLSDLDDTHPGAAMAPAGEDLPGVPGEGLAGREKSAPRDGEGQAESFDRDPDILHADDSARHEAFVLLRDLLDDAVSTSNPGRRSFQLIRQMCEQGRMVPPAMLGAIDTYLNDLTNIVVPQVAMVAKAHKIPPAFQSLTQYCRMVGDRSLDAKERAVHMERIDRLVLGLRSLIGQVIDNVP